MVCECLPKQEVNPNETEPCKKNKTVSSDAGRSADEMEVPNDTEVRRADVEISNKDANVNTTSVDNVADGLVDQPVTIQLDKNQSRDETAAEDINNPVSKYDTNPYFIKRITTPCI